MFDQAANSASRPLGGTFLELPAAALNFFDRRLTWMLVSNVLWRPGPGNWVSFSSFAHMHAGVLQPGGREDNVVSMRQQIEDPQLGFYSPV